MTDRTAGEGYSHKSRGQVVEESHCGIGKEYIPMNLSNKDGQPSAEREEGRPLIKENTLQPNMLLTQSKEPRAGV